MLFGSILSSPLDSLFPEQALRLANIYLDSAHKTDDPYITLVLCHDTEVSLSQAKKSFKRLKIPDVRQGIATAYDKLGELLDNHRLHDEAEAFRKKAVTVGYVKEHCRLVIGHHLECLGSLFVGKEGYFPNRCYVISTLGYIAASALRNSNENIPRRDIEKPFKRTANVNATGPSIEMRLRNTSRSMARRPSMNPIIFLKTRQRKHWTPTLTTRLRSLWIPRLPPTMRSRLKFLLRDKSKVVR